MTSARSVPRPPALAAGGFTISPDTWLDGYLFPAGAVSGYDQGLYVVALEAAQRLGLNVSDAQISQAISGYRALYDPNLGFVRWLSTTTYKGRDVLAGDALALKLFNQPLLGNRMVVGTLRAQARTLYGVKALATQDGGYVPAGQFRTLTTNSANQVVALDEPGVWYRNGGSWFLWEYVAEYAARQGDAQAATAIAHSVAAEVAVTPMMKEFKATVGNPGIGSADPDWPYPLGWSGLPRQGYGWDAAFAAFRPTVPHGTG